MTPLQRLLAAMLVLFALLLTVCFTSTLANLGAPLFLVLMSLIAAILLFVSIVLLGVPLPLGSPIIPPSPRARRRKPTSAAYSTMDSRRSPQATPRRRASHRRARCT